MTERRLKHFGWGREGEGITPEEEAFGRAGAELSGLSFSIC